MEQAFDYLDAPVARVSQEDVPMPYAANLEAATMPSAEKVIEAVWGFFAAYFAISALMILLLMATGLDQETAFSAVAACLNNLGPGLGDVGQNFAYINDPAKWILCLAMLLGRLEFFTVLVVLSRSFWR